MSKRCVCLDQHSRLFVGKICAALLPTNNADGGARLGPAISPRRHRVFIRHLCYLFSHPAYHGHGDLWLTYVVISMG